MLLYNFELNCNFNIPMLKYLYKDHEITGGLFILNERLISEQSTNAGKYENLNPAYVIFLYEMSDKSKTDDRAFKKYMLLDVETNELHSEYINIINVNLDSLSNEKVSTRNNDLAKCHL